jgi:multicomponent Na+:H+ antiporter subunit E
MKKWRDKRVYLLYFLLWVIFNGNITLEICLFGIVIAAVIFAFTCKFMDYSIQKEKQNLKKIFKFFRYVCVLIMEIMKANFAVIHMILSEEEELEPTIVSFHSDMKTPAGRAFLANAITLTPGTITVSLEDSDYVVHCLDSDLAVGLDSSVFVDLLTDLEKDA